MSEKNISIVTNGGTDHYRIYIEGYEFVVYKINYGIFATNDYVGKVNNFEDAINLSINHCTSSGYEFIEVKFRD